MAEEARSRLGRGLASLIGDVGGEVKDPNTEALEKSVSDALGLAVSIDHANSGGTVHIRYRDLDQLDDIVRRLGKKA